MRHLTECCGGYVSTRTPWCDMVSGCDMNKNILHLWYKLRWLQEEIEKRSSYLGKFRRTEEAQHLLDLISMTRDEEDLFYPFARAAMADIADILQMYAPKHGMSYIWNEGCCLISYDESAEYILFKRGDWIKKNGRLYVAIDDGIEEDIELEDERKIRLAGADFRQSIHYLIAYPKDKNISLAAALDTAIGEALIARIIQRWLEYAYPDEAPRYEKEYNERYEQIRKRCNMFAGNNIVNRIPRI